MECYSHQPYLSDQNLHPALDLDQGMTLIHPEPGQDSKRSIYIPLKIEVTF